MTSHTTQEYIRFFSRIAPRHHHCFIFALFREHELCVGMVCGSRLSVLVCVSLFELFFDYGP